MTPPPDGAPTGAKEIPQVTDPGDFGGARRGPTAPGPALPARIGRYRILEVIGEGGMGTVYLAEQSEPIVRRVAIKLIRAALFDSSTAHRFQAERQALARMSHPCIAQVYEAGDTESGQPFFAMEYVPGQPITGYCDSAALGVEKRLELFAEVCRGIHHAHQKGILHRDIKPGNILVATEQGRPVPKIIDFGIAKALDQPLSEASLTAHGRVIGTPFYSSPEAVSGPETGADPDTRSDVYSLGVLLFELLVGERPFGRRGDSLAQVIRQVAEGDVPAPSARFRGLDEAMRAERAKRRGTSAATLGRRLRGDLDWITLKATARAREQRYDSAAELAADLERHQRFEPVKAGPPHRLYVLGKLARRYRAALTSVALVVLALGAGIVARSREAERASREAAAARQAQAETQEVVDFMVDLFEVNDPGTSRGATVTARELLDRGAAEIKGRLGSQPLSRARLLDTIGIVYRRLELPEPAAPLLKESLAIRERLQGPDHPEVATSLKHLGELHWIDGQYAAAETALRRALAIREKAFGPDHLLVAEVLDNLGSVHAIQAHFDAAEPMLRRALEIRERALGPEALPVAASLDDLGVLLIDKADGAGAEPLFRRALEIRTGALGPEHPEVAASANGLAIALHRQGRIAECVQVHQRALAVREKVFGAEGAPVAQTLNNLANAYLDLERDVEAEAALLRAAQIWEKVLGAEHPRLGTVFTNLADLYRTRGEARRAEPIFRRAVAILEKALGARHPRVAYPLKGLSDSLKAQRRTHDALAPCRRALAIREAALGPEDPETKDTRADCEALAGGTEARAGS